jgi:SAM-dependent methyltransferase
MTVSASYFDGMYARSPDPWGFTSRWYEARKHAITMAMLPKAHYREAFEPGCSIGVLSDLLAPRCERLLCCDIAPAAVKAAAERTAAHRNVQIRQCIIPQDWPEGQFDLIVLSEILYYFAGPDLDQVLNLAAAALRPGATLLAVHWRHPVAEHPRSGDNVHAALAARPELAKLAEHTEPDFIAEAYLAGQGQPISVAASEGLLGGGRPAQWHETGRRHQGEHGRLLGRCGKPMSAAR